MIGTIHRPEIAAVIFDCDGTLVDSEGLAAEVLCELVGELGLKLTTAQMVEEFRGGTMTATVNRVEELLGRVVPEGFVETYRARMEAAFEVGLQPIPGAAQVLAALSLPYCIASSGPPRKMAVSLRATGLKAFFPDDRIFSCFEVGVWKPDPAIFLHAARQLGVAPQSCAVVEDSIHGIQAGVAAGMTVYALHSGPHLGLLPPEVIPLASLTDLLGTLPHRSKS